MGSVGNGKNNLIDSEYNVIDAKDMFGSKSANDEVTTAMTKFSDTVLNKVDTYINSANSPTEFRDNVTNDFINTLEKRLNNATSDSVKNVIYNELEKLDSDIVSWLKNKQMKNDTSVLMQMRKRIRDLLDTKTNQ